MLQYKVGIIQINSKLNDIEDNILRARCYIENCIVEKCALVCLPEAFATSINLPKLKEIAAEFNRLIVLLCSYAKQGNIYIAAGVIEEIDGKYFSVALIINPLGEILARYRKTHIYPLEGRFITPGKKMVVVNTSIGKMGLLLGYDINFPEISRFYFKHKVEVIICLAQIPNTFTGVAKTLALARAAENNCYFILASSVGDNTLARMRFMGNSLIARSPVGLEAYDFDYSRQTPICSELCEDTEGVLTAMLDIAKVRRELRENPHYYNLFNMQYCEIEEEVIYE